MQKKGNQKMKNNFNLPEAPIQNNEGILIFSYENTEFVVDVNSKESRKECSRELNRISGKHYEWCKETEGKNHWVLYDTAMYRKVYGGDDLNALTYNSGCGLAPIIPINATSCTAMFEKCEDILDLGQFNTHNIVTMSDMFAYYRGTELDVSMLDTGNVESFTSMFFCCNKLKELNLINLDTAKAVDMGCMFWNCSSLVELDLSSFSTELVQSMHHMFWNCRNLRTVDLSSFSTVNVKDMEGMFKDCRKLYKLDLSSFSTENLDDASQMFWGCKELLEIKTADKEPFGINVPTCDGMYKMCDLLNPALESLLALAPIQDEKGNLTFTLCDIFSKRELAEAHFNVLFNKVYEVNVLLAESREKCLKELKADTGKEFAWLKESRGKEHWVLYDTDVFEVRGIDEYLHIKKPACAPHIPVNATACHLMFRGCSNINFSNFYTNNVVDMSYMFYNADDTVKLDLSGFDTSKVENMEAMFSNMYALKYLDISSFNTERLINMDGMFNCCVSLVKLDLTSFDTGNILKMAGTFNNCKQLEEILVSDKWSVCWGIEDDSYTFNGTERLPNYHHATTGADKGYDSRYGGYLIVK